MDDSDFARTRLTHSIEVSAIACQMGQMLTGAEIKYLPAKYQKPFGHFGEATMSCSRATPRPFVCCARRSTLEAMLDDAEKDQADKLWGSLKKRDHAERALKKAERALDMAPRTENVRKNQEKHIPAP